MFLQLITFMMRTFCLVSSLNFYFLQFKFISALANDYSQSSPFIPINFSPPELNTALLTIWSGHICGEPETADGIWKTASLSMISLVF